MELFLSRRNDRIDPVLELGHLSRALHRYPIHEIYINTSKYTKILYMSKYTGICRYRSRYLKKSKYCKKFSELNRNQIIYAPHNARWNLVQNCIFHVNYNTRHFAIFLFYLITFIIKTLKLGAQTIIGLAICSVRNFYTNSSMAKYH